MRRHEHAGRERREQGPRLAEPAPLHGILALQRAAGNAAVVRMLQRETAELADPTAGLLDLAGGQPEVARDLKPLLDREGLGALRRVRWLREDLPSPLTDFERTDMLLQFLAAGGSEAVAAWALGVAPSTPGLHRLLVQLLPGRLDLADAQFAVKEAAAGFDAAIAVCELLRAHLADGLLDIAKREVARARGDVVAAGAAVAAMSRMREQEEEKAETTATEAYKLDVSAAGEAERKAVEAVHVPKSQMKARKGKDYQRYTEVKSQAAAANKSAVEAAAVKRDQLQKDLAAQGFKEVVEATVEGDPATVEWLRTKTGDMKLVRALSDLMLAQDDPSARKLVETVLAAGAKDPVALASRCRALLERGVAEENALDAASFTLEIPDNGVEGWIEENGALGNVAFRLHLQLFEAHRKRLPAALALVRAVGFKRAEALQPALEAAPAAILWILNTDLVTPQDRDRVLNVAVTHPQQIAAIPEVFDGNRGSALYRRSATALVDLLAAHPPAVVQQALSALWRNEIAEEDLQTVLGIMATGQQATSAAAHFYQEEIALPQGVSAQGWVVYNGVRCPRAMFTARWETDEACLKHYEEMGSPPTPPPKRSSDPPMNPTKAKLELYYADMVAAIELAYADWSFARPEASTPFGYGARYHPNAKGHWRFNIKVPKGAVKPQVHHADSAYAGSYWTTHDT